MTKKYHAENLIPALRLFIRARNEAVASGFTDNGGAIHSVERILDILSVHLCYPHLSHINNLKRDPKAEISAAAFEARKRGERLLIEHVKPQRAYAKAIIDVVNAGASDEELVVFIRQHYRLVVLTADETIALNRLNRSRMTDDRIADAGIILYQLGETSSE
jgi:hypothetical protein